MPIAVPVTEKHHILNSTFNRYVTSDNLIYGINDTVKYFHLIRLFGFSLSTFETFMKIKLCLRSQYIYRKL